jgi:ABC-type transport system substrate-binding protein
MRMKTRLILAGATLLATLGMATSASAETTCVRYNLYWMECTTTTYNPHTQMWEQEVYYAPYQNIYDTIE